LDGTTYGLVCETTDVARESESCFSTSIATFRDELTVELGERFISAYAMRLEVRTHDTAVPVQERKNNRFSLLIPSLISSQPDRHDWKPT
jgi:hypothetical protein